MKQNEEQTNEENEQDRNRKMMEKGRSDALMLQEPKQGRMI